MENPPRYQKERNKGGFSIIPWFRAQIGAKQGGIFHRNTSDEFRSNLDSKFMEADAATQEDRQTGSRYPCLREISTKKVKFLLRAFLIDLDVL